MRIEPISKKKQAKMEQFAERVFKKKTGRRDPGIWASVLFPAWIGIQDFFLRLACRTSLPDREQGGETIGKLTWKKCLERIVKRRSGAQTHVWGKKAAPPFSRIFLFPFLDDVYEYH